MPRPQNLNNPYRERIKRHERDIGYYRKALSYCSKDFPYIPDIESARTEEYAQMGHCHYREGCFKEAIEVYLRARATDPNHFQVLFQLALSYTALRQYEEARDSLHEIIERVRHPYDYSHRLDARLQIAHTYIAEGKESSLEKARKYILLARDAAPNHPALTEIYNTHQQQQNILSLIKQVRCDLQEQNWRQANTRLRELKRLAPHHTEVQQMEATLHKEVANHANHAMVGYQGTLFPSHHSTSTNKEPLQDLALSSLKEILVF